MISFSVGRPFALEEAARDAARRRRCTRDSRRSAAGSRAPCRPCAPCRRWRARRCRRSGRCRSRWPAWPGSPISMIRVPCADGNFFALLHGIVFSLSFVALFRFVARLPTAPDRALGAGALRPGGSEEPKGPEDRDELRDPSFRGSRGSVLPSRSVGGLLADPEALDGRAVALDILPLQVIEQAAAADRPA